MEKYKVLVIDDEKIIRERLKNLLDLDGYQSFTAESGPKGLEIFDQEKPEIVLVDIKMPGMNGIEVLKEIKEKSEETEVIIITGHGGVDTAIEALKEGAFSYIQKPIEYDELEIDIRKALEKQEMQRKLDKHVHSLEVAHYRLKEQQAQILQAAKLTALGQLGAGVAHEMNQPLMAISTHIETLLMNKSISSDRKIKDKILKIKDQFVRLGTIVKRLSDYSGGRTGECAHEDINRPINDAYYLFDQQLKDHNIHVVLNLQGNLPKLYIDRYQIQDVAINFLVNARDAVDEVYNQEEGGKIILISKELKDMGAVLVGIIDNGKPIEKGTESELFNPFFTTKAPGKGTGLGLSICYTIIKEHRGLMSFANLKDKMKMFYFVLSMDKDKDLTSDEALISKRVSKIFETMNLPPHPSLSPRGED